MGGRAGTPSEPMQSSVQKLAGRRGRTPVRMQELPLYATVWSARRWRATSSVSDWRWRNGNAVATHWSRNGTTH